MSNLKNMDVLLGLQWGDEGKGKFIDKLAERGYYAAARFQGGPNAGHTLVINGENVVLHQPPSSVFRENIFSIIGDGVVLDLVTLGKEFDLIQKYGGFLENLRIGSKANLILPTHIALDSMSESSLGEEKIGTTKRGIGPVHEDRAARKGVHVGHLSNFQDFINRVNKLSERHIKILKTFDRGFSHAEEEKLRRRISQYIDNAMVMQDQIVRMTINCSDFFFEHRQKSVLAEGAQGVLLDVLHGEVPNVTSSHISPASACIGLGVPTSRIRDVFGLFKAYVTKVGAGALPTKMEPEHAAVIQDRGGEKGSTTGRNRDCGYLDLPVLRYACQLVDPTQLFMGKVDVLFGSGVPAKIATAYQLHDGSKLSVYDPRRVHEIKKVEYREFGNLPSLNGITDMNHPAELDDYYQFIESQLEGSGIPVSMVSHGPGRDEVISTLHA